LTDEQLIDVVDCLQRCDFYNLTMPNVSQTRWNTLNDALETRLAERGQYCIVGLNLGVNQGWAKRTLLDNFCNRLAKTVQKFRHAIAQGKASVKEKSQQLMRLRETTRNPVHLSVAAFLHEGYVVVCLMFLFSTLVWRKFHGVVQSSLISPAAARTWHSDIVCRVGVFWDAWDESGRV
jgi:hypothetical protein